MNINKLKKIVAEYSGFDSEDDVNLDMSIYDDLVLDDDTYGEMIDELEDEFDVDILSYDGDFDTLQELANYIKKKY